MCQAITTECKDKSSFGFLLEVEYVVILRRLSGAGHVLAGAGGDPRNSSQLGCSKTIEGLRGVSQAKDIQTRTHAPRAHRCCRCLVAW